MTKPAVQDFEYGHLPAAQAVAVAPLHKRAVELDQNLPDGTEKDLELLGLWEQRSELIGG